MKTTTSNWRRGERQRLEIGLHRDELGRVVAHRAKTIDLIVEHVDGHGAMAARSQTVREPPVAGAEVENAQLVASRQRLTFEMRKALTPDAPLGRVRIVGRHRRQAAIEVGRPAAVAFPLTNEAILLTERRERRLAGRREKSPDAVATGVAAVACATRAPGRLVAADNAATLRTSELQGPRRVVRPGRTRPGRHHPVGRGGFHTGPDGRAGESYSSNAQSLYDVGTRLFTVGLSGERYDDLDKVRELVAWRDEVNR